VASPNLAKIKHKVSPSGINAYFRCPRKFDYRYIHKHWVPYQFKPYLAVGGATHKALARHFMDEQDGKTDGKPIDVLATEYLQKERYPDDQEQLRAEHIPQVIQHAERALSAIPAGYTVRNVENEFKFLVALPEVDDDVAIASKVDLVIGTGEETYDHIDFKTGKQGGDLFQNVISRITVKDALDKARMEEGAEPLPSENLRTVVLRTSTGSYDILPSDRESHRSAWISIRQTLGEIAEDDEWRPRPDPFVCRWCEFNQMCDAAELEPDE